MKIVIIPAKGGSTRLPNKNMHLLNGRPLIEYTLDYIKKFQAVLELQQLKQKNFMKYIILQ